MAENGRTNGSDGTKGPRSLLNPEESVLVLIDHQPTQLYGVQSHDRQTLINNTLTLAKAAKAFGVPVILTTAGAEMNNGRLLPQIQELFPDQEPIDRSTLDAWEDPRLREAVLATGRRQIVMAGLLTEICLTFTVIAAREDGREVYAVTDASGALSEEAHEMAVRRMIQAGAVPTTAFQVLAELQRDWARTETAPAVAEIVKQYGGAYGQVLRAYEEQLSRANAG